MSDRLLGGLCVLLACAMALAAWHYTAEISYEPVGPRAFPLLLAALLGLGGLWLCLRPAAGLDAYRAVPWRQVGVTLLAVLAYALAFEWLGFPLATLLVCVPVGMAFGGRPLSCLAAGALIGIGAYYLFDRLLDVVLPAGWLAPWLGVL